MASLVTWNWIDWDGMADSPSPVSLMKMMVPSVHFGVLELAPQPGFLCPGGPSAYVGVIAIGFESEPLTKSTGLDDSHRSPSQMRGTVALPDASNLNPSCA